VPEQSVWPDAQLTTQRRPVHTCPEAQGRSQPPQWRRSVWVSRQVVPQAVKPVEQERAHVPDEHTWPAGHTRPHAPQF